MIHVEYNQITNSNCEKLLEMKIDHNMQFNAYIDEICRKVGQKLNYLE